MDLLFYLLLGTATASWRLLYLGLILPVWRLGWKGAAAVAATIVVGWKCEREAEQGAYQ